LSRWGEEEKLVGNEDFVYDFFSKPRFILHHHAASNLHSPFLIGFFKKVTFRCIENPIVVVT